MNRLCLVSTIAILFLAGAPAYAAEKEPQVWASVNKHEVRIGDRIRYSIEVKAPRGVEVAAPGIAGGKMGDLEVKESGSEVKKGVFGNRTNIYWYDIAAYESGKYTIPSVEIRYRPGGASKWVEAKTIPQEVVVKGVIGNAKVSDIRDIKGPIHPFEINWIIVLALILIITLAAAGVTFYIKKRNAVPPKLPHETALEELEAAKAAYVRGGEIKEYYVGISDCIRRYIERIFALKAPEMTTQEFLESLKESAALLPERKDLLRDFLNACDLVKFAKYKPAGTEIEVVFSTAKKFIEETKDVRI